MIYCSPFTYVQGLAAETAGCHVSRETDYQGIRPARCTRVEERINTADTGSSVGARGSVVVREGRGFETR
jgi:hypothetical protein